MNHIDWLVTIGVFLAFIVWSLSFYFSFFPDSQVKTSEFADLINEKIKDVLFVETYETYGKYNSPDGTGNSVINFTFNWTGGNKNSTRVYVESLLVDYDWIQATCIILGSTVYVRFDPKTGDNDIKITYSNLTVNDRCKGIFDTSAANQTIMGANEMKKLISQQLINAMTNQTYDVFKNNLSISRDFRVEINESGTETYFGSVVPKNRNIYVRETYTKMEESGNDVDMRVMVW